MTKIPVVETCNTHIHKLQIYSGRRSGLMVSEFDSGSSGKGFKTWPGTLRCVHGKDTTQLSQHGAFQ